MTSYEFECALVYLAEQVIKTFGKDWPTTVYVCKKCYKTICEDLGLRIESED